MFSPRTNRRLLLVCLVLVTVLLAGCASVDVQCGMKADYSDVQPVPAMSSATIHVVYGQGFPDRRYGESMNGGVIRMAGAPPSFSDICGLAKLGHEVAHQLGGRHQ